MPRKSYKPEEIIKLLRVVEIEVGKGANHWIGLPATGLYRAKLLSLA